MWQHFANLRATVAPYGRAFAYVPGVVLIWNHIFALNTVSGRSMSPTLNPDTSHIKDIVLLNRWGAAVGEFKRGDVVVLKSPINSQHVIKRIVALGGDMVQTLPSYPDTWVKVPKGHAWVEGDEPFHSRDSNKFGPVSLSLIDSKVPWIVLPFHRWGPVPRSPRRQINESRVITAGSERSAVFRELDAMQRAMDRS